MRRHRVGLVASVAAIALLAAPIANASAPPPGWSAITAVPGTAGWLDVTSATAPNGTNVLINIGTDPDSTYEIDALVQRAGATSWTAVPPRVKEQPGIESTWLTAAPNGTFWLAWRSTGPVPEVYAMNLNPATKKWTRPVQVFHDAGFGHTSPQIAVAGDGTVGIAVSAQPTTYSDPPVYRIEVAMLRPGKGWKTHFMTPADAFASDESIAANATGEFAVSWLQGYTDTVVAAATRATGASAPWHTATLSVANDSQREHLAIGADGTVAVAWSAPTFSQSAERLSTTRIGTGVPRWKRRNLVASVTAALDAFPVVYNNGDVTVVWGEGTTTAQSLWAATLAAGALSAPVQLSPVGNTSYVAALGLRPDGRAALLYQRFSGTPDNEGMSYISFAHGVMGPTLELTDLAGDASYPDSLGIDAESENNVFLEHGTYPDTDLTWMTNRLSRPSVMTSAYSGHAVARARISGHLRVGRTLHCVTGLWVGARSVHYSWLRNGKKIAHHTARKYRVAHADLHKHLSCTATGSNTAGGHRTVKSKKHLIKQR
ncbi:MAG TPA: hypothetical protein VHV79_06375 [Mycobacteriales bacterium]|nr:hypothetical protein [Mycobacteriales bacterium]